MRRKEKGEATFALFIDLVKAFDRVDRTLMWQILAKFGVPPKVIDLVRSLYDGSTISINIDGIKPDPFANNTGVKQGDNLAPILFLFVFQAALETIQWPAACKPLHFQPRLDGALKYRDTARTTAEVIDFEFRESLYADDCAAEFETAQQLILGTETLRSHLATFGLGVHYAHPNDEITDSKTVALHILPKQLADEQLPIISFPSFAVKSKMYDSARVPWVRSFKYLGSHICETLTETLNIGKRISAARQAFGALRVALCDQFIDIKARGRLYVALVVSVLLSGCEAWTYSMTTENKLNRLNNYCCRAMSKISRRKQWKRRICSDVINRSLGVQPIDYYVRRRVLKWIGHVARMSDDRMPKRMLFGWSANGTADAKHVQNGFTSFAHRLIINLVLGLYHSNSGLHPPFQLPPPSGIPSLFASYSSRGTVPVRKLWNGREDRRSFWLQSYRGRLAFKGGWWLIDWVRFANWYQMAQDRVFWRRCCNIAPRYHFDTSFRVRPSSAYGKAGDAHHHLCTGNDLHLISNRNVVTNDGHLGFPDSDIYQESPPTYHPPFH